MNLMTKRGSQDNVAIYEHYCDEKADLLNIPEEQITLGSTAIVLRDEGNELGVYIANSDKECVPVAMSSGGNSNENSGSSNDNTLSQLIDGTITKIHNSTATSIRKNAFANCTLLTDIDFPNVEIIESSAFRGGVFSYYDYDLQQPGISDTRIPITSAIFPKCKQINDYAFSQCYQLSQISFPECTFIGQYAFGSCPITKASFPECTTIYTGAFADCPITEANFPKCTSISSNIFGWNPVVEKVTFNILTQIPSNTFASCSLLTTVEIPNCESIGQGTFTGCASLSKIMLSKCNFIGSGAFDGCSSLESMYMLASSVATLTKWNGYITAFSDTKIPTIGHIYVPMSLVSAYQSASGWKDQTSRIVGLTDAEIEELLS